MTQSAMGQLMRCPTDPRCSARSGLGSFHAVAVKQMGAPPLVGWAILECPGPKTKRTDGNAPPCLIRMVHSRFTAETCLSARLSESRRRHPRLVGRRAAPKSGMGEAGKR